MRGRRGPRCARTYGQRGSARGESRGTMMAGFRWAWTTRRQLGSGCIGLAVLLRAVVASAVPSPTLDGPITGPGSPFIVASSFNPSDVGYTEVEYFMAGTAAAY